MMTGVWGNIFFIWAHAKRIFTLSGIGGRKGGWWQYNWLKGVQMINVAQKHNTLLCCYMNLTKKGHIRCKVKKKTLDQFYINLVKPLYNYSLLMRSIAWLQTWWEYIEQWRHTLIRSIQSCIDRYIKAIIV